MLVPTLDSFSLSSLAIAFSAALVGGLHCAAMCGPLRILVGTSRRNRVLYQLGRLSAYLVLGLLGGLLGFSLPWWIGLPLAFVLILAPITKLVPTRSFPILIQKFLPNSPLGVGLSSALLPCGWLHGWLAIAIASRSATQAMTLLFLLWLGSLPALELFSEFATSLIAPVRVRFPKLLPIAFLLLALLPFAWRSTRPLVHGSNSTSEQVCH